LGRCSTWSYMSRTSRTATAGRCSCSGYISASYGSPTSLLTTAMPGPNL
jgi:hypothetical protein